MVSCETLSLRDEVTAHRRALHRIPEISTRERETQRYVLAALEALRPDALCKVADTGARAVFLAREPACTLAFRADMDALLLDEETGLNFASRHEGHMHACGHDGHMAMLLGLARAVSIRRDSGTLGVNVVCLFQPAEESYGGARRIINEGGLDNPSVDAVFGLHLMPDVPVGCFAFRPGPMMAEACEFDIELKGVSAHGAQPHKGVDAVAAAAHLYALLQTLLKRAADPFEQTLLTVGRLTAGTRRNIVAEDATLECIARAFTPEAFSYIERAIERAMAAVEAAFGVKAKYIERERFLAVDNHPGLAEYMRALLGGAARGQAPTMMAEDFSFYQRERPGLFMFLGAGDETHTALLHTPRFDFNEEALLYGLEAYLRIIDAPPECVTGNRQ